MNNFTKRELEYLCQFLNIAIEDYQEPDETYELRDKIQSMIDDYPEICPSCDSSDHCEIGLFEIEGKKFNGWYCYVCKHMFKVIE
jgi:hypothetical protein